MPTIEFAFNPFKYKRMGEEDQHWKFPQVPVNAPTEYGWRCFHPEHLTLGHHTDIGCNTVILAHCGVEIHPYAQIGPNCSIISKSTIDGKEGPVIIMEGACIGANSIIMPGVTIGEYCIIGAGSFVNKEMPASMTCIQKRKWGFEEC